MIKLVVLDVDGTITEPGRTISTKVISAMREIMEKNTTVSLVSGNVIPVMYALKVFLGINGPMLGENGGIMLDGNKITNYFSIEKPRNFFEYISKKTSAEEIITNRWRETSVGFTADVKDIPIIEKEAAEFDVEIVDSSYAWHILNKGQNKGFAVNALSKQLKVNKDEILVVGDSDNDVSMFMDSVHKATVNNGTSVLKDLSEYVSDFANGDGVVDIFTHFSLM